MPIWNQVTNNGTVAAGAQVPYSVDWMQSPFAAAWSVNIPAGGSATFNVETTLGDVLNLGTAGVTWDAVVSGATATSSGAITTPVLFARVNYTAGPATHPVTFRVVQGMSSR